MLQELTQVMPQAVWHMCKWLENKCNNHSSLKFCCKQRNYLFGKKGLDSQWLRNGPENRTELLVKVTQSCLTPWDPMDCIVHGILQARIPEWVAVFFSRGSSQSSDRTYISHIAVNSLSAEPQGKPQNTGVVTCPFSKGSSQPRNQTGVCCIAGGFFTNWTIREAQTIECILPSCLI